MKLIEIADDSLDLEPPKPVKQTYAQYKHQLGMAAAPECRLIKQLGRPGRFGVVYQSPSDPNIAVKTYRLAAKYPNYEWDAYTQWLIQVMNRNNPFFPKIHDVQLFVCGDAKKSKEMYGVVHLEKLEHLKKKVYANLYPFNDPDYAIKDPDEWSPDRKPSTAIFMHHFLDTARYKDPALYDALRLIYRLANDHSFDIDTHDENIMWRKAGDGYHMVFTDPIAWGPGKVA